MSYIIDFILVALFFLIVIISAKKGFFLSLFDLLRTIISFFFARLLSESLSPGVYTSLIEKGATNYLTASLGEVGTTDYVTQVEQALNSIPDSLDGIMQMLGIDKNELIDKVASANLGGDNLVETILHNLVEPIATALVQFIMFVVLVIVIGLVLKIVIKLFDKLIKKLPKIKSFNTLFGAVFGAFRGAILVVVISMLFVSVASFINNESFIHSVNSSFVLQTIQSLIASISGINI